MIYHTHGKHANHYITDAVQMWFEVKKKKKNLWKYVNDWAFFSTFSQWQKKTKNKKQGQHNFPTIYMKKLSI